MYGRYLQGDFLRNYSVRYLLFSKYNFSMLAWGFLVMVLMCHMKVDLIYSNFKIELFRMRSYKEYFIFQ